MRINDYCETKFIRIKNHIIKKYEKMKGDHTKRKNKRNCET